MALQAKFLADFSDFTRAVDAAQLKLRSFEGDAHKVGTSLNKMADSFSGKRIIQEATVMTSAIEKLGGVTGLTEREMQRVSATVGEAVAKMKAMGVEVPPGMQKLADATKGVGTAASGSTTLLSGMAKQLAGMFTAGAIIAFGRELLRMGDDIVRVSDRTGLLTDEVQQLSYIAKQSGNSIDELVGAIGQFQNRLASGDKSAVAAVKALGLSFSDLRAAGPFQQLQLIADAVAAIPDPAGRAQVAMDLFGRAGIAILPTLQAEFRKLGEAAPKMSHNTVLALDQAGDALDTFKLQVKVWAAESYNYLGKFFDQFSALVLRTTAGFLDVTANIASVFQNWKFPGADKLFPGLASGLQDVRDRAQFARDAARMLTTATEDMGAQVRKATPLFLDLGASMDGASAAAKKKSEADELLAAANKKIAADNEALSASLERVRFQHFHLGEAAVLATRNVQGFGISMSETVAISNDYSRILNDSQIVTDAFGHSLKNNVMPSLQGVGGELHQNELRYAANSEEVTTLRDHLGDLSKTFSELGNIGGGALGKLTTGIGTMITSAKLALESVDTLKSGFGSLGAGSTLKGIASIASGIGGIVSIADTAIRAVKALWNWARGGEEGTVVNPARDSWFGGRGVQDIGDQLAAFGISGNDAEKMIERVFKAKTKSEFDSATGAIDRILGGSRSITDNEGMGFATGTGGKFLNFGSGTRTTLHGKEAVVTEAEGLATVQEIRGLRDDLRKNARNQKHLIAMAVRDALIQAG